jgi:hypothetical protein
MNAMLVLSISLTVFLFGTPVSLPKPPPYVSAIACTHDGVVGLDSDSRLVFPRASGWQPLNIPKGPWRLWQVPGGSTIACCIGDDRFIELEDRSQIKRSWRIKFSSNAYQFSWAGGRLLANSLGMLRLNLDGTTKFLGLPPKNLSGFPASVGPDLLRVAQGWITCYPSSISMENAMRGHCIGPAHRYDYPVEFGHGMVPLAEQGVARPFTCGDVVVSVHKGLTQSRRHSDGGLVGQVAGASRTGSQCLDDGRILLVGKRDLRIYDGPQFRQTWRRPIPSAIKDVAVCGTQVNVLLEKDSSVTTIDLNAVADHRHAP